MPRATYVRFTYVHIVVVMSSTWPLLLGATLKSFLLDADLDLMTSKVAKQHMEEKLGVKIKGDDSKEFAQLCLSITVEILKTREAAAAPPLDSSEDRLLVARTDCHGMAISPRTMPPKRAASEETQAETQAVVKRYRKAIDEVAEEYVCPITAELPIDPVTAEDGRCYERCAIEEWFARQPQPQVKSPVTNELMGKRLFPAVQVRNSLKRLVESGAISGSKADAWKKAMADEALVAVTRQKAEGGDAKAMRRLGFAYRDGRRGLKADRTQAFMWFKRAADLKDVRSLTACGYAYLLGKGVKRSSSRGLTMLGGAALLGSEHACGTLGQANAEGLHGFDKNPQEATRWYREMQKCDCRDSVEKGRERAAAWLREHP